MKIHPFLGIAVLLCLGLFGCTGTYYSVLEKFGKHKRDLLRDQVKAVKEDQVEATEQFKDALTQLKELTGFKGGDLEKTYETLQKEYNESESRASAVKTRVRKIEQVAGDLFKEWDKEIDSMENAKLKADSRDKLRATQRKYDDLHAALKTAESRMDPVLTQFRDQVLYLKHNLNAQAIAGLQAEVTTMEIDVKKLIEDMNASIREADSFIKTLPG